MKYCSPFFIRLTADSLPFHLGHFSNMGYVLLCPPQLLWYGGRILIFTHLFINSGLFSLPFLQKINSACNLHSRQTSGQLSSFGAGHGIFILLLSEDWALPCQCFCMAPNCALLSGLYRYQLGRSS